MTTDWSCCISEKGPSVQYLMHPIPLIVGISYGMWIKLCLSIQCVSVEMWTSACQHNATVQTGKSK